MEVSEKLTLTVPEAARLAGVSISTMWAWTWQGIVPSRKLGGRRLILREALLHTLAGDNEPKAGASA